MTVISLLTDFGTKDGFAGTMKGVIWQIAPDARIADISHEITPQNILEGAIALWRAAPFFPAGSVHIAVVDPGVGTSRRPMAAYIGSHFFVGPDNGLFTPFIEAARARGLPLACVHLDQPRFWLPDVSHTFHGRDIFAPVGAHLACGVALETLGTPFSDPALLTMPHPVKTTAGYQAHITVVDAFGNLTTDLPATEVAGKTITLALTNHMVKGLSTSYGQHLPGELIALVDSENFIEIAVVNGSAARVTGARVGDVVEIAFID